MSNGEILALVGGGVLLVLLLNKARTDHVVNGPAQPIESIPASSSSSASPVASDLSSAESWFSSLGSNL